VAGFDRPGVHWGTRRQWVAGLLGVLYPGLGHAYLRRWPRALGWFCLAVGAVVLLLNPAEPGFDGALQAFRDAPATTKFALSATTAASGADAFHLARERDTGPTCPSCGKDVDHGVDFCIWCTEPLPEDHAAGAG
jgi:hypothetical protein